MKQTLSIAFALALAGALLTGCDRPADKAGAGGTSASGSTSGSASGSAGGTAGQPTEQKKAPSSPTPPPSK
jgi:hypothetical protein